MMGDCGVEGSNHGAWYESVLESIRAVEPALPGAGVGMIRRDDPPLRGRCEACDDDDPCLPRWEDDGGGLAPIGASGRPHPPGGDDRPPPPIP